MIAIIIAGGSGSRLWPLSTPSYPKHLLKVGDQETSLLQQTYQRISAVTNDIYVISEKSHDQFVREQLPALPAERCIVEPARRGTANCALLAVTRILNKHDENEPVVILWADHYIRDTEGFSHTMRVAGTIAEREQRLVLVGVEPYYPATGFGYIKKRALLNDVDYAYEVDGFKEKPNSATAESYVRTGSYLWNSGYFIATTSTLKREINDHSPEMKSNLTLLQNDDSDEAYLNVDSANIDGALIERIPNLLVVPATFDWLDLGSYGDLHQASLSDEQGNFSKGNIVLQSVENSFVQNEEDKPVAVIGLDNIAVINTKDGILVTRKDLSQAVGDVSKQLYSKENS